MKVVSVPAKTPDVPRPLLGSILWTLNIQYFIVQFFVSLYWSKPYSLLHNTISDLGNATCGSYHDGFVCSPAHSWMNASFVTLGLSMGLGSFLIRRQYTRSIASTIEFGFMCLAGLGTVLVGLFPENTISTFHITGAALTFLAGNLALVLFGFTLRMPPVLRYYTSISGLVALVALLLFVTHSYLGIGIGGMERITAYPQTIWMIVFGIYSIRSYLKQSSRLTD